MVEWSNTTDCKSVAPRASKVQILPDAHYSMYRKSMDKSSRIILDIFYGIIFLVILIAVFFTYKGISFSSIFDKKESITETNIINKEGASGVEKSNVGEKSRADERGQIIIPDIKVTDITVEGRKYKIRAEDYKDTAEGRKQGLSSTTEEYLCSECGMLFVWPSTGVRLMWMKDMNYDIDMYWLDQYLHVLHAEHNVRAKSYNSKAPEKSEIYGAEYMAKYVLETRVSR